MEELARIERRDARQVQRFGDQIEQRGFAASVPAAEDRHLGEFDAPQAFERKDAVGIRVRMGIAPGPP